MFLSDFAHGGWAIAADCTLTVLTFIRSLSDHAIPLSFVTVFFRRLNCHSSKLRPLFGDAGGIIFTSTGTNVIGILLLWLSLRSGPHFPTIPAFKLATF